MVLGVVLMTQHGPRSVDSRIDRVTDAGLHPVVGDVGNAAVAKDVPLHHEMKSGAARSSALSVKETEEVAEDRLPKMETFPAVAQSGGFLPEPTSGSGAKELGEVVDSPQVAKALQSLKEEQERPLEVSAIEIQPL
jgi:Tfp pilus assembly PilM family ATPase